MNIEVMNNNFFSLLTSFLLGSANMITTTIFPVSQSSTAIAQSPSQAVIFDPPSNVRRTPNGQIICSIKAVTSIYVYGYTNGWYGTSVCGSDGYIHESQIRFQNASQSVQCFVTDIRTGQLAVRKTPAGESIAGLDNGNVVEYIKEANYPW